MGGDVSEDGGMSHRVARCSKNFIIFVTLSLIMPAHLQLLLSLLAYLCHPTSRAPITQRAPARASHREQTEGQEIASIVELRHQLVVHPPCRSIGSQADVRQKRARRRDKM